MRRSKFFALGLFVLAGCTTPAQWEPTKAGLDMQLALYECERDARTANYGPDIFGSSYFESQQFFERCMTAKGFVKAPE